MHVRIVVHVLRSSVYVDLLCLIFGSQLEWRHLVNPYEIFAAWMLWWLCDVEVLVGVGAVISICRGARLGDSWCVWCGFCWRAFAFLMNTFVRCRDFECDV